MMLEILLISAKIMPNITMQLKNVFYLSVIAVLKKFSVANILSGVFLK